MRILHVMEVSHGGVPTLVHEFASAQVGAGHEVHTLAPTQAAAGAGVTHRWNPRRGRPDTYPAAVSALRRTVADVRPDVVHLHSFFPGLWGRLRRLPAPRVVYQPHSWAFATTGSAVAVRALAAWESRAARRCDAVVVNCADERAEGLRHGVPDPMHVIGVPIDTARFHPAEGRAGRDRAALVCLGRLSRQKGQDQLAAAWERRPIDGADLYLVGPGDPEPLAELAPVTFGRSLHAVGGTDDPLSWWWRADVAVLPSRYEGQSVSMAEALACGVPVVMTEVNGAREAIAPPGEDAAGAVVRLADMDALLDACARRVADPQLLRAESAAARRRAVDLFSLDSVLRRLGEVYGDAH